MAPRKRRGRSLVLGALVGGVGRLPSRPAACLGRWLGDVGFLLLGGRRRAALANLAIAFPDLPEAERRRLCRRSFEHLGLMAVELCFALSRPLERVLERVRVEGLGHLRAAMERHGRVLVLTAHVGNWELLSVAHRLTGFPLTIVVRPLDAPALNALAERLRLKAGVELVAKRGALRAVLSALDRGRMVGVLLDQNASRREGVFVPFFGRPASTSKGLALLAMRTRAPVVPIFAHREADGRHLVAIHPALEASGTPERDRAIIDLTMRCNAAIEAAIRRTPEQWLWIHRRWRTRPPAERETPG